MPEAADWPDEEGGGDLDRQLIEAETSARLLGRPQEHVLLGRFEVLARLGAGSMGAVYAARDTKNGRRVALKTLLRIDSSAGSSLKREFRALQGIVHPNLVVMHELFRERGLWFITMEHVDGVRFDAWLAAQRPDDARLRNALSQLCQALVALHASERIHCDLKPANVLVTSEDRVVVLDFGLVTQHSRLAETISTRHGILGTPAYMAPEQCAAAPPTAASDWYALGTMLFEALAGRSPWIGSAADVIALKQTQSVPDPRTIRPECDGQLAELCVRLLQREPNLRPDAREISAVLGGTWQASRHVASRIVPASAAPFVGRRQELATLRHALLAARADRATTVLLAGPSGVGKSALLDHFAATTPPEVVVLRGRCHEQESVPFNVFDGLMDHLLEQLKRRGLDTPAALPRHIRALAQLFPALEPLSRLAPVPRTITDDPRERRRQAFEAMKELLLRVTDHATLVMVVDDLQWGDIDSFRLLNHVLGPPEAPPLLFVGAYRDSDVDSSEFLRLALASDLRSRVLHLETLEPETATELAHTLLEREQVAEALETARAIAEDAQGLPFFIVELVEQWKLSSAEEPQRVAPAISLDRTIQERVRKLPQPAQRLLEIICVAGRPLLDADALELAGQAQDPKPLLALCAARLVHMRPGDLAEVYHHRIREVLLGAMPANMLRAAHARIATTLQGRANVDPESLLLHWLGADEREAAGEVAVEAAHAASQKLAFNRAVELFQLAIGLLPPAFVKSECLQRHLADALANAGRGAHAADAYLQAAEVAEPSDVMQLRCLAASQYLRSGRMQPGIDLLRGLMAQTGMSWPNGTAAAVTRVVWNTALCRLRGLKYELRSEHAIPAERLARLDVLGCAFRELGVFEVAHGVALQARFLREALAAGEPRRLLTGLAWEAFNSALLADSQDSPRTTHLLRTVETLASELGTPRALATAKMVQAGCNYFFSRFEAARETARQAETLFREQCVGTSWEEQLLVTFRLGAIEWTGGLEEIAREAPAQAREAKERDDRFCQGFLALSMTAAQLMADAPETAWELLEEQRRQLSEQFSTIHVWVMHRSIDTLNYLGRGEDALAYHDEHWQPFVRSFVYRTKPFYVLAHWFRVKSALGAAVQRLTPEHLARAERARRLLERTGRSEALCLSVLARAAIAHLRGDAERARIHLERGIDVCRQYDCGLLGLYAKRNLGVVLAGDEGARLIAEADAALRAQLVTNPERWVATYAPGFAR